VLATDNSIYHVTPEAIAFESIQNRGVLMELG